MTKDIPVVYILHGDDSLGIRRFVDDLLTRMGDPGTAELNTARLDGRTVTLEELYTAANALPFLAERRLVILTEPLARLTSDAAQKRFLAMLDGLPQSTALVLILEDTYQLSGRDKGWQKVRENHWLLKWLSTAERRGFLKEFRLPLPKEMPDWIRKEAERQGGSISMNAAVELATYTGSETRLAALEISKLLTYMGAGREAGLDEVRRLCIPGGQAEIFDAVEALGAGNTQKALKLMHILLQTLDFSFLFGMIVRQFRLLILSREMLEEKKSMEEMITVLRLPRFAVERLTKQAQRFSMSRLKGIYRRLLDMDLALKTSAQDPLTALDLLIVESGG